MHDTRKPEILSPGLAYKVLNAHRRYLSPLGLWRCQVLLDSWPNSQGPCVAQISGSKLYKIADADLFTKGASQDSSISPARGCPQGSQLSLPRARQGCLTVEMGAVFPPGAITVFLFSGSQGRQWIPAPSSQEGTLSFGVPKKNCRTRSARSARQKSRARTWPMTSLNCQGGSRLSWACG